MFCCSIENLLIFESEQSEEIDSRIKKFKEISTIEKEKQRVEKRKKDIKEEISKKEQIEKSKEEEISKIEEEIFGLLKTIGQKVDTLSELRGSKNSIMFTKKVLVDKEYLIEEIDDHIEFKKEFIPYLRFIDLAYIDSKNLKVSGIDFRGTNIRIKPQEVYNKDLSNSKFDDQNFAFKDFSGCDLRGTDLSDELDCFGYENAITDDNTILPNDVIDKKTL
jgi:vacuolar-type H+-ATPase subunit I/STV1